MIIRFIIWLLFKHILEKAVTHQTKARAKHITRSQNWLASKIVAPVTNLMAYFDKNTNSVFVFVILFLKCALI